MENRLELEQYAKERFSFFSKDWGLKEKTYKETWVTTFLYFGKEIAFELVFDWRDIIVSVIVVRHFNGKIPDGYYVDANGKCIRKYLIKIIAEQKLDLTIVREIKSISSSKKLKNEEQVKLLIEKNKQLLEKYGKIILELGEKCFERTVSTGDFFQK